MKIDHFHAFVVREVLFMMLSINVSFVKRFRFVNYVLELSTILNMNF